MEVKIMLQFNGKQLTLPINPEEISIDKSASNSDINIIGVGKTVSKDSPGLINMSIDSFFPGVNSRFYTGVKPKTCIDFINEIWNTENKNNNVGKIVTSGLEKNINMYFVIDSFSNTYKAGEEEDVYYRLKIKEYIPYGVKIVAKSLSGLASARAVSTTNPPPSKKQTVNQVKTYKVVRGDCLWNITKKYTGNGGRWRELYNINKKVIGKNPNLIFPNQVLTLPTGW